LKTIEMLRILKIALIAILSIVLWIATLLYIAPRFDEFPAWVFNLVLSLPIILPAAFGLYLLFCLIVGVKAFKTVPKEAENLQKDIARAKKALKAKGISSKNE
jgi:hypothetical protein